MSKNFIKRICLIIVFATLALFLFGCDRSYYSVLGNPTSERFSEGQIASCVWDITYHDGKIFIGSGDYDKNTRPTDIWAFDLQSEEWVKTGTVEDDAITRFLYINNKLVAPGIDPAEDWTLGNYYTYNGSTWEKTRTLPNAVHTFDMLEYEGKLFAGIGVDHDFSPFVVSIDGGQTFNHVELYKDNKPEDLEQYAFSRAYELIEYNSKLYSIVRHAFMKGQTEQDGYTYVSTLYVYENGVMNSVCDLTGKFNLFGASVNMFNSKATFNEKLYFASDYLYQTSDMQNFEKIRLPQGQAVSKFIIENDTMYILGVKQVGEQFRNVVYSTKDVVTFEEVFCFDYSVPALSMVKVQDDFYLGMGNRFTKNKQNGEVIKVYPKDKEAHSNECAFSVINRG